MKTNSFVNQKHRIVYQLLTNPSYSTCYREYEKFHSRVFFKIQSAHFHDVTYFCEVSLFDQEIVLHFFYSCYTRWSTFCVSCSILWHGNNMEKVGSQGEFLPLYRLATTQTLFIFRSKKSLFWYHYFLLSFS